VVYIYDYGEHILNKKSPNRCEPTQAKLSQARMLLAILRLTESLISVTDTLTLTGEHAYANDLKSGLDVLWVLKSL
jgi:hypothetical protein